MRKNNNTHEWFRYLPFFSRLVCLSVCVCVRAAPRLFPLVPSSLCDGSTGMCACVRVLCVCACEMFLFFLSFPILLALSSPFRFTPKPKQKPVMHRRRAAARDINYAALADGGSSDGGDSGGGGEPTSDSEGGLMMAPVGAGVVRDASLRVRAGSPLVRVPPGAGRGGNIK